LTARPDDDRGADPRALLERPTLEVAAGLLGWHLVRDDATGRRAGRIVELEGYIGEDDLASHARFGRTARNEVMYGPPGRAYVYLVYGMHDCLNIVTGPPDTPAALLVRAVEPLAGVEAMRAARERRARDRRHGPTGTAPVGRPVSGSRLAAGPGLVCAAFDLDRSLTGDDLLDPSGAVRIEPPPAGESRPTILAGPRVGIGYAGEPWVSLAWRFAIAGSPSVSRPPLEPAVPPGPEVSPGRPERRT